MGVIDQLFLYRHNSLTSFVIAKAAACVVRDRGGGVARTAAAAWAVNSRPANGGRHGHSLLLHRIYYVLLRHAEDGRVQGRRADPRQHRPVRHHHHALGLPPLPVVALPPLAASPLRVDDFILLYYVEQTSRLKNKVHEKKMFKSHSNV